jgi:hypothetical protein
MTQVTKEANGTHEGLDHAGWVTVCYFTNRPNFSFVTKKRRRSPPPGALF